MKQSYLLDTHALIFWAEQSLTAEFLAFLDEQNQQGRLFVSDISFWEMALLAKKGRITVNDPQKWADELLRLSGIRPLTPTVTDMISSVALPDHHKDPFDRLLIAQANAHELILVTRDATIPMCDVATLWM